MMHDLTWTGNQIVAHDRIRQRIMEVLTTINPTVKGDVWCESTCLAISEYFGIPLGHIRVASGATQIIEVFLKSCYQGLVVDVIPNFHLTSTIAKQESWNYRTVEVRDPKELLSNLKPYFDNDRSIISLSSPRNPLGYQFDYEVIAEVIKSAKGLVLVDEVYADFSDYSLLSETEKYPNLVVARTFSKAWGLANLRIGFAASQIFTDEALSWKLIPNSVTGLSQQVVNEFLADSELIVDSINNLRIARDQLITRLREVDSFHVWPTDANYICVETPHASEIADSLLEHGFKVTVLRNLRGYPKQWKNGIRMTVPAMDQIDPLMDAIGKSVKTAKPA